MKRICLTGATGFLGGRLTQALASDPTVELTATAREPSKLTISSAVRIADINGQTDWSSALQNQQVVIHTAARTHIINSSVVDPLTEYRKINVDGTVNLAHQAAEAGAKRFIFISSIKVNGEKTVAGRPARPDDEPAPSDPYGISKWEAEQELQKIAIETAMEVVIIRPPLIYGPGVKGNLASLIKLINTGFPLPFGSIDNRRSLIALDNLIDLIIACIDNPNAANQIFLASDGQDLSTAELIQGLAQAMGRPKRLLPVPVALLTLFASVLGKKTVAGRLSGSLQVDSSKAQKLLNWTPPLSVKEGLRRCTEPSGADS